MINLFSLARHNALGLRSRVLAYLRHKNPTERASLEAFSRVVHEDGMLSINMGPWKLLRLLEHDEYLNPHQRAKAEEERIGTPAAEVLRKSLGRYYERRVAFDGQCDRGFTFNYAALNIGGPGAVYYGEFCLVLAPASLMSELRLVYLEGDSLARYVTAAYAVDADRLKREAAPEAGKHHLALLKAAMNVPAAAPNEWPIILCNNCEYIEAIFDGPPKRSYVAGLRVSYDQQQRLWELVFDGYRRTLTEDELGFIRDHARVSAAADRLGIVCEVSRA